MPKAPRGAAWHFTSLEGGNIGKAEMEAAKHDLNEFTAFRTIRIDPGVRCHEFVSFEKTLTVGQEFIM